MSRFHENLSGLRDLVEAFVYIQRQQGWPSAFQSAVQFLRSPLFEFHRGFLLRKSLEEPIDVPSPDVEAEIRRATVDDDLALLGTIVPPLRVKRFAAKIRRGEICFVAVREQPDALLKRLCPQAIAYVFAGFANTPSTEDIGLDLGPEETYLWAGYALPQYRRQGVVKAVNLSLCHYLREKGYKRAVLLVDRHNRAALGHCHKMGYDVTDRVTYLRILRWRYLRCLPIEEPA